MLVFGIDAHERSHTVVAVDERGCRQSRTDYQRHGPSTIWRWSTGLRGLGDKRLWAVGGLPDACLTVSSGTFSAPANGWCTSRTR